MLSIKVEGLRFYIGDSVVFIGPAILAAGGGRGHVSSCVSVRYF